MSKVKERQQDDLIEALMDMIKLLMSMYLSGTNSFGSSGPHNSSSSETLQEKEN